ncbi:cell death activator CIDE-3-like [Astyanax mexicanus]|uniref:Cell death activator CIDE-3-like n=1 Tax=Astyanax mexicanus TaxID=7994 RepID=A0A8B9RK79_ASTMX|nr:cell death activator CIDE-3-like [Astyanax mexicanus]
MDYAKKSLNLFTPLSDISHRCVSASASVLPSFSPHPRPFRVTNSDRSVKKGIMADGLRDLLDKTMDAFHVSCVAGLVLDEDGTGVDTEDFFNTLKDSTVLMVLEKGQKWTPLQKPDSQIGERKKKHRKDLAKLTLDFYKNHPKEFIGCLNVHMTLYGMYSMSYDLQCYHAKRMLREFLRWTLFSMQATGHVLLGTSCYMQHLIDEEEKAEALLAESEYMKKPLQAIQWKKTAADHRN